MPKIKKTKKALVIKTKNKKTKPTKNTLAYYECLNACCQQGIKPKNISQVARECKTNALAINAKISTQKVKAFKKIKQAYAQMGKGLAEFIK